MRRIPSIRPTPRTALVERLIAALPPLYREVLLLRHLQDMSVADVAAALALPEGTVKIRLFRAREMMRQKWETFEMNETREDLCP
jgi:RNA polymerase sigma factor (sigma-70 family)